MAEPDKGPALPVHSQTLPSPEFLAVLGAFAGLFDLRWFRLGRTRAGFGSQS